MTVVIDTNVVLGMAAASHPHAAILDVWLAGRLKWAVSTDILTEYDEILGRMKGPAKATQFLDFIQTWGAPQGTLPLISPSFFFRTIAADHDDFWQ